MDFCPIINILIVNMKPEEKGHDDKNVQHILNAR